MKYVVVMFIICFLIIREEKLLNFEENSCFQISDMRKAMEPYDKLWRTASDFEEKSRMWLDSPYWKVDASQVETDIGDMYKAIHRLNKTLIDQPASLKIAQKIRVSNGVFSLNMI